MNPSCNADLRLHDSTFDGIFGDGAAEVSGKQAMHHQKRLADNVGAEEPYTELDHCNRRDPSSFELNAHIANAQAAKRSMDHKKGNRRKMKLRALFFPAARVGRKAKYLARKLSFRSHTQPADGEEIVPLVDETPRRVKSKLPSEEHGPHVEPGTVARAIKSLDSVSYLDFTADSGRIPADVHICNLNAINQGAGRNDQGQVAHQLALMAEEPSPAASDATNTSSEASGRHSRFIESKDSDVFSCESDPEAVVITIDGSLHHTNRSSCALEEHNFLFEQTDALVDNHGIAAEAPCDITVADATKGF